MSVDPRPAAELVAIGDELVLGHGIDTNSAAIAKELARVGLRPARFTVVGDRPGELDDVLADACRRSRVVVATGGLGPTEDDRTRDAAAAAAGVDLAFDEGSWTKIRAWFRKAGRDVPDSNRRQAFLPAGATVLENRWGTAPGFAVQIGDAWLFALPGVPREMRPMVEAHVLPWVRARLHDAAGHAQHTFKVIGPSEAVLGERLAPFMDHGQEPQVGITAHWGLLTVRVAAHGATDAEAAAVCRATADAIRPALGDELVFEGEETLAEHVGLRCIGRDVTIATAESCTGGLLGAYLTDVPGISSVYPGGVVSYANEVKVRELGVDAAVLDAGGAVAEPVAAAMARGVAERFGTRVGVGISGIAGPDGGSPDKPVGTVCFGLSIDGQARAWTRRFAPIGRDFVRHRAVAEVFVALLRDPGLRLAEPT